eukprot:jgi/Tetstr1/443749/TSEL_031737.t1
MGITCKGCNVSLVRLSTYSDEQHCLMAYLQESKAFTGRRKLNEELETARKRVAGICRVIVKYPLTVKLAKERRVILKDMLKQQGVRMPDVYVHPGDKATATGQAVISRDVIHLLVNKEGREELDKMMAECKEEVAVPPGSPADVPRMKCLAIVCEKESSQVRLFGPTVWMDEAKGLIDGLAMSLTFSEQMSHLSISEAAASFLSRPDQHSRLDSIKADAGAARVHSVAYRQGTQIAADMYIMEPCGHAYCEECAPQLMKSGNLPIMCCKDGCQKPVCMEDIKIGITTGPRPVFIKGMSIKRFDCDHCMESFCTECRVSWHEGYTCTE